MFLFPLELTGFQMHRVIAKGSFPVSCFPNLSTVILDHVSKYNLTFHSPPLSTLEIWNEYRIQKMKWLKLYKSGFVNLKVTSNK